MSPEYRQQLEQLNNPRFLRLAWGGGVFLLLLTGWLWWHSYYQSPRQVFWETINNNLIINGVTTHTKSEQNGQTAEQDEQLALGVNNVVHINATIQQKTANNQQVKIATETIGTPTTNFNRFVSIQATGKKTPSFAPVINVWGTQKVEATTQSAFAQALYGFDLIMPFAHLNATQRKTVLDEMQRNNVYTTDFSKTTHKTVNNKKVLEYNVSLSPMAYVTSLKQVDALSGLNLIKSLDVTQYQNLGKFEVTVDLDPVSHQMVRVFNNGQTRNYTANGISPRVALPSKAIPQAELQTKLSSLLSTP